MRDALHLCREHGQPPAWWEGLDQETQIILMADLQLRAEEAKR